MSKNIFITGTGTDIGKTFVTGLIVKKLHESGRSAAYYKAAMSGNERREDGSLIPGDALYVKTVSGIGQPLEEMCPYIYENAFSPHLASRIEGNPVQMQVVKEGFEAVGRKYEYVTMEGSGGILCPLCYDEAKIQLEDVIRELAEKKIGIEMCPISNLQTKAVSGPEFYPIREFLDHGVRVTVNTDNRTVSNTTMTKELEFIQKTYGVRDEEVLLLMRNAVDAAFASDTVKEKLYRKLAEK